MHSDTCNILEFCEMQPSAGKAWYGIKVNPWQKANVAGTKRSSSLLTARCRTGSWQALLRKWQINEGCFECEKTDAELLSSPGAIIHESIAVKDLVVPGKTSLWIKMK